MSGTSERWHITDASIRLDSMPADGRDVDLMVDETERGLIAAQLGLTTVDRLAVKLHAVRFRGGIRVTGRLESAITQPSVVSLEPVHQSISEAIDRVFLPAGEKSFADAAGAEIFVDLEGDDVPDHFEGGEADLTDFIVESLALAVDAYPKAAGESLETLGISVIEDVPESPFAALARLKKDTSGGH